MQIVQHFPWGTTSVLFNLGNAFTSCNAIHATHAAYQRYLPVNIQYIYPIYIYIYIYIYIHWQHFFINTNFVEHDRHFLSIYFLVDPFVLPYCFYRIQREFIDVFSLIVYISSTFCPTLCHHQGRIYYKSDAPFLLLCKSVFTVGMYSVCF